MSKKTGEKEKFCLSGNNLAELIRGVLEKGACYRLTARGWSMYPGIHDGDVITISPFKDIQPYVGEVVAFSVPEKNKLIVHRIISKTDNTYLIKGDNNLSMDGVIAEANLLGVVIKVEREGKVVFWPDRFHQRGIARLYFTGVPAFAHVLKPVSSGLSHTAVYILHSRAYRRIANWLLKTRVKRMDIAIVDSTQAQRPIKSDVHGFVIGDLSKEPTDPKRLVVAASINGVWVGHMTFVQSPADCHLQGWWAGDGHVRLPYKECGIEARMFAKAEEALSSRGVSSIMINLPADSREMETWCTEVGMKIMLPDDRCSKCADSRILLEKRLDIKADGHQEMKIIISGKRNSGAANVMSQKLAGVPGSNEVPDGDFQ